MTSWGKMDVRVIEVCFLGCGGGGVLRFKLTEYFRISTLSERFRGIRYAMFRYDSLTMSVNTLQQRVNRGAPEIKWDIEM